MKLLLLKIWLCIFLHRFLSITLKFPEIRFQYFEKYFDYLFLLIIITFLNICIRLIWSSSGFRRIVGSCCGFWRIVGTYGFRGIVRSRIWRSRGFRGIVRSWIWRIRIRGRKRRTRIRSQIWRSGVRSRIWRIRVRSRIWRSCVWSDIWRSSSGFWGIIWGYWNSLFLGSLVTK